MSQLVDAQVIKRLRDLDMPLAAVAEVVRARDPEVTRRVIADHERAMRVRMDDLIRVVAELQHIVSEPTLHTPVFVRTEPTQHVLAIAESVPNPEHDAYAEFLGRAYPRLSQFSSAWVAFHRRRLERCTRRRSRATAR